MTSSERLVPVSFHLRNFNKYLKLDLTASQAGNLTFIGENAAGKTTLANCFFPMLIDGSISTPSFNPAKGTDKLTSKKPRNSARDMRTFESMLLGWGSGAMKSRTGYTYMELQSTQRQAILGIGAHRADGDSRKPTWWFVALNEQPDQPLQVHTCDKDGLSFEKADFERHNAALGSQLHIFEHFEDYREYVATGVYGFASVDSLEKLVTVYRLLASPILTAGNARFTPIREALKNAQESIDPQIMVNVAETQRDVNRMNGMLKRLDQGQTRLKRIQKTIFWGNLNHLNELMVAPYNKQSLALEQKRAACEAEQQKIAAYQQQLTLLQGNLDQANETLDQLKDEQANQKSIRNQRANLEQLIAQLNSQLNSYRDTHELIIVTNRQLETLKQKLSVTTTKRDSLRDQEVRPQLAKLAALVEQLSGLNEVLGSIELSTVIKDLAHYLQINQKAVIDYQSNQSALTHMGQDVEIVTDMQNEMDTHINQRLTGALVSRFKAGLHQDNREVHMAGAAKMNQNSQTLMTKQQELMRDFPALESILDQPELLNTLATSLQKLRTFQQSMTTFDQQLASLDRQQQDAQAEIARYESLLTSDFDENEAEDQLQQYQATLATLIVDPEIDQKVAQAQQVTQSLVLQERQLQSKKAEQQGRLKIDSADQQRYQVEVDQLEKQLMQACQQLKIYAPAATDFSAVLNVVTFCQQNRVEIRNNPFSSLVGTIDRLIHNNGTDGIDRNALDDLFEERGHAKIASAMQHDRTTINGDLTVVAFDFPAAVQLVTADQAAVTKALKELNSGNEFAQTTYLSAATQRITAQYKLIESYNQMLLAGVDQQQSIKLKVELTPTEVTPEMIAEARNPLLADQRPLLRAEIRKRLEKLANDTTIADDQTAFMDEAKQLLDTRQWSEFKVLIKRRQSSEDDYEIVDDKFVQSGGSGAEKAQAMVLPLLLVPKMVLQRATKEDAPYLVMFDEFADKLDPETAKSFAKTIARFGFNFIATMPEGAQNKILADGVANIAYDVIAAQNANDGRFHPNTVVPALIWQLEAPDGQLS